MQMNPYVISEIVNGQYTVTINLDKWMSEEISTFEKRYREIYEEDDEFKKVGSLNNHILKYKSESIFPLADKIDPKKKRVMIIFGNPATTSVAKGMFFYSRGREGHRHQLWGKLDKAGLLSKEICEKFNDREIEANRIRHAIIEGSTSQDYILSLTTFYSFPTPVKPQDTEGKKQYPARTKYGDAAGVEKLFKSVLTKLQREEIDRLNHYPFGKGATWICTQKSSYEYIQEARNNSSRVEYWPMSSRKREEGSGKCLRKILTKR